MTGSAPQVLEERKEVVVAVPGVDRVAEEPLHLLRHGKLHARILGCQNIKGTGLDLTVTRVGSSAGVISPESPVKYSDFDAAIATATARKLGLKPGQALHGPLHRPGGMGAGHLRDGDPGPLGQPPARSEH